MVKQPNTNIKTADEHEDKNRTAPRRRYRRHRVTMPAIMRVSLSLVMLILMAGVFTWFILYRQFDSDFGETWDFMHEKPQIMAYSYLVTLLLMCTLAAILWRPFLTIGISFVVVSVITYIHVQKYTFRAAPLLPEDFQMVDQAGNLMEFIDPWGVARLAGGAILVLFGSALLEHCAKNVFGRDREKLAWWDRFALIPRATFGIIAITTLAAVANPVVHHGSGVATTFDWLDDLTIEAWNQTVAYKNGGFIVGFLYNLSAVDMKEPDNYSEETLRKIANKYAALRAKNQGRVELSDVVDNVVVILNESFFDPSILGDKYAHTGGDVTPNLHRIFREYPSGYMYSPEYGGNTANVEFAVLTGLSNFWARTVPYTYVVAKLSQMPGLVSYTKDDGIIDATAIHAYDGTMYKRNLVYTVMDFDEFFDRDTMTHTELENGKGYISDSETYQEILETLKNTDGPQFVMAATMQNHASYDSAQYGYDNYHFYLYNEVENGYAAESAFESLYHSDQYLGDFIEKLDKLNERTVVLWFGDHAGGVLNEYINSEDQELVNLAHLTPYFIYVNFDVDELYTVQEVAKLNAERGFSFKTQGVDLPVVSPNCLANMMYDVLGAQKPALMYLLDDVCEETPILAPSYYSSELPANTPALLEYELINYDVLGGKRYWLGLGE